jgi:hypothetical protein
MLTWALGVAAILASADTLSVEDVRRLSADLFRVDTVGFAGQTAYAQSIAVPPEHHPLADFASENRGLLTYLVQHVPGFSMTRTLGRAANDAERRALYTAALRADTAFDRAFLSLALRYLMASGTVVIGADSVLLPEPRSIPASEFLRVAVRFFSPFIDAQGGVATHVCTAFNDVRDLPGPRNVVLEALAYSAISSEMRPNHTPLFNDDFSAARRLMNRLTLASDSAQLLDRARGVMWGVMGQSRALGEILHAAYEQRAAYLPFRIVDLQAASAR